MTVVGMNGRAWEGWLASGSQRTEGLDPNLTLGPLGASVKHLAFPPQEIINLGKNFSTSEQLSEVNLK